MSISRYICIERWYDRILDLSEKDSIINQQLPYNTPRISAVIITFNEEKNIGRCLESLQGIADEIIVVDFHSTDRIGALRSRYGVRFIEKDFTGYTITKNWENDQVSHPYILSLDADEALSEELRQTLMTLKPALRRQAYRFNRRNFIGEKWIRYGGWYPDAKVRLFHKEIARWTSKPVHEEVTIQKNVPVSHLRGDILHYSFESSADQLLMINNNSAIRVEQALIHKKGYGLPGSIVKAVFKTCKLSFLKLGVLDGKLGLRTAINAGLRHIIEYGIYKKKSSGAKNPKKVCLFNTTPFWGGGEKWHYETVKTLRDNGFDVRMATSSKGTLQEKIRAEGIACTHFDIGNLSFLNPFKIYKIAGYFRKSQIHTVVFNGSADLKAGGIAAFIAGVPVVIYRRGLASAPKGNHLNLFLFTSVVTHFIANSHYTLNLLCEKTRLPKHKINHQIIYNAVNAERYQLQGSQRERPEKLILGIASRLVPQKGIPYALDMAKALKEVGVDFELRIAGTGKSEHHLKVQCKRNGITDVVHFVGFVEDMAAFLNEIDIYLCPSEFEGFGFSIAEAMLAERPVIAFDTSSNPEIVQHGQTGYIVRAFDVDTFIGYILDLKNDPVKRAAMGAKGRAYVLDNFSYEKQSEKFLRLLNGIQ